MTMMMIYDDYHGDDDDRGGNDYDDVAVYESVLRCCLWKSWKRVLHKIE